MKIFYNDHPNYAKCVRSLKPGMEVEWQQKDIPHTESGWVCTGPDRLLYFVSIEYEKDIRANYTVEKSGFWNPLDQRHVIWYEIINAQQVQDVAQPQESLAMNYYAATAVIETLTRTDEKSAVVTKTTVLPLSCEASDEPLLEFTANYRLKAIKAAEEKKLTFKGSELKLYIKLDANIAAVN